MARLTCGGLKSPEQPAHGGTIPTNCHATSGSDPAGLMDEGLARRGSATHFTVATKAGTLVVLPFAGSTPAGMNGALRAFCAASGVTAEEMARADAILKARHRGK